MLCKLLLLTAICYYYTADAQNGSECEERMRLLLKYLQNRNAPSVGKRSKNNSNEDFEKFFLKASKSVPRIGRSGEAVGWNGQHQSNGEWNKLPYVYTTDERLKYPLWSDIAERFEYDPELFSSPDLLMKFEQAMGDDPSVYDWDKIRFKRTNEASTKV